MTRPLILDFSIPRINENKKLPYFYDTKQNLNVIDVDGRLRPFINADDILLATITKTSVARETRKQREGNDNNYLELVTKTEASIESDDDL